MPAAAPRHPIEKPWAAGLRAARANVVPGLMVQGLMLVILLAYFFHPATTARLDALARVKQQWGYGYSAVSAIIAGALIPELLRIAVFQRFRPRRANLGNLAFTIPFWCFMGTVVDAFYRMQALWFGSQATIAVVIPKVLVDQLLYSPLFAAPVTALMYDLKQSGYRFGHTFSRLSTGYYREVVVPTIVANWSVWTPIVVILYSLPSPLQIPLFSLALTLWVMLYTWMSEKRPA